MPRGDFITDSEFRQAVEALLSGMLDDLDEVDADAFEPMVTPGNLIVAFETGEKFVLSQQTPNHELWLSANLTAWHFVCEDGTWVERDSGADMLQLLSGLIGDKIGQPVVLTAA